MACYCSDFLLDSMAEAAVVVVAVEGEDTPLEEVRMAQALVEAYPLAPSCAVVAFLVEVDPSCVGVDASLEVALVPSWDQMVVVHEIWDHEDLQSEEVVDL